MSGNPRTISISQRNIAYPTFQIPSSDIRSNLEQAWINANHLETAKILADYYDVPVPTINFVDFATPDGTHSAYDYSGIIVIDTSKLPSNTESLTAFVEQFFYHLAHHKRWKYNLDLNDSVKFELSEGSRFATEIMKKES